MRQSRDSLDVRTPGRGLVEITGRLADWLAGQAVGTGLLTLFVRHTSASLLIQENADPDVGRDLLDALDGLAPRDGGRYRHDTEGPDDMPAHIRAMLTQTHLAIPVGSGRLELGRWQGVFLIEHRDRPHSRQLLLHYIGE